MNNRAYPGRPLVGIGVVLLKPDAVLLVRRSKAPAAGSWSIPGGAQKLGEPADAAARRELMEETGLRAGSLTLAAYVDSIHRNSAGEVEYHYTILDFAGAWQGGEPVAGGDVSEAAFVSFADLAAYDLWSEASRVIDLARRLVSFGGDGRAMPSPD